MGIGSSEALMLWSEDRAVEVDVALAGFLAGYSGNTRLAYQQDLRQFVSWCYDQELGLFAVQRTHIELSPGGSNTAAQPAPPSGDGCRR